MIYLMAIFLLFKNFLVSKPHIQSHIHTHTNQLSLMTNIKTKNVINGIREISYCQIWVRIEDIRTGLLSTT